MSFYGGGQNGSQPGSGQQQQMGRQPGGPGLQNVQQVLTPQQLFNINVNPNQLHNFFNEHNSSQNQLQLNAAAAAAAANAPSILLQSQQTQSFPVNLINEQLGVGVSQLISPATVSQNQMQGMPISMSSALSFPQTIQVHAQTPPPQQSIQQQAQPQNQQSKQRVFTGTVTKIHDNFGFIDEEVFFQMGVVKGPILPKEGDRVLVEADFNASMPFKWNATRVQIVNMGGGLSSSLNNLSNLSSNQQHHLGFNTTVGIQQKQSPAPPPPVLTSQAGSVRPHGAQPVTIVSNPHSVYSGASGTRGRTAGVVVGAAAPPTNPMVAPPRDVKRPLPQMGLPLAPEAPSFISNSGISGIISERDLDRDRGRERESDRSREHVRDRSRSRERVRERSRDRIRPRSRERSRERIPDRSRDKVPRNRSRSRDRPTRDRSRDRSRDRGARGVSRDRSRERTLRDRSPDRLQSRLRSRSRERSRDRNVRDRSVDRRDRVKRERSPEKTQERSRERLRDKDSNKDRDHRRKSTSPSAKNSKDDSKRESKVKDAKEKEKQVIEKGKQTRDRSPVGPQSHALDRSKRSRSKESVRTDKGVSTTEKSRSRSSSPRRKNVSRAAPRYAVEVPKFSLDMHEINVKEIQRRYPNLYVPSDFFLAKSTWMDTFPLHKPFELGHSCPVQIMRKGVQKIEIPDTDALSLKFKDIPDILEPADASFIFKAKVMIPTMSSLETIYRKACGVAENLADVPDNPQHIDRLMNFIVGMKTSKHEVMALGGPWSPSIDGQNPQSDPQTLINTAIRSVRALTGINLCRCKHWYRFMELYYKRSNCLETVVFYLPDVWSCLPGTKEWNDVKAVYKLALHGGKPEVPEKNSEDKEIKSNKESKPGLPVISENGESADPPAESDSTVLVAGELLENGEDDKTVGESSAKERQDSHEDALNGSDLLVIDEASSPVREDGGNDDRTKDGIRAAAAIVCDGSGANPERMEDSNGKGGTNLTEKTSNVETVVSIGNAHAVDETAVSVADDEPTKAQKEMKSEVEHQPEPTHYSRLSPKQMNVAQLKEELSLRNLSAKGLKAVLTSRLVKALKEEEIREKEVQASNHETENSKGSDAPDCPSETTVIIKQQQDSAGDGVSLEKVEVSNTTNEPDDVDEDEHCIRLVNPSLIFETQDDECSIEDGELKEDGEAGEAAQTRCNYESILANFPPDTFPIIKPGMKEEDIKMWERRYVLPKNPRLLIHPSMTAKCGNFDCLSMTLGLLRDYRIIDKKEEGFEVSLFSEFFHEMLQRDFAFRIYQEIVAEANKPSTDETTASEKDNDKEDKSDKDNTSEPNTKKRKLSNASSVVPSSHAKKTTDPYLLLSFIFFDVTRCGYITETDLEDLCGCIGIGLTRAQIRKVVQKVVHKGTLYYRKWTDKPEKMKSKNKPDDDELRFLSLGNKAYFPVFILRDDRTNANCGSIETEENSERVFATVNGKSYDVKKLLDQLDKCETDRSVAESSLNVMKNSLNEAKSQVTDVKKSNESMKDELNKTKEALKKSESSEKSSKENVEIFRRSTERYLDRIKDLVKFPSTSSKDKSESMKESVKPKDKSGSETKEKVRATQDTSLQVVSTEPVSSLNAEDTCTTVHK